MAGLVQTGDRLEIVEYYAHHKIAEANPRAYDPVLARELWEYSLEMVAV